MTRRFAIAVLAFAGLVLSPALAGAVPFLKGPYLQNVSKASVTVMWQSSPNIPATLTLQGASPRSFPSKAESMHEVVIDGLDSGTRYEYRIESAGQTRNGEFATAPESGSPFSFVVFGDSRSNANAHARVVERVRQEVPDFLLGTGDIVNEGGSEADWSKLFEIEAELLHETVLFPSLGNHDRQGRGKTAANYRRYFSLPENSPDPERYYAFTYASARFLVLDSNAYSFSLTDQTAWIEEQLQSANLNDEIQHVFVVMHHPPYSISLHGGRGELREAWTPLFERYRVDAVFSGHDHVYSRAKMNGVNYFVSGGGGAPLYGRKENAARVDREAVQFFERVNHHLRVHVVGRVVEVSAVRADGTIIETLSWGRLPSGPSDSLALRSPLGPRSNRTPGRGAGTVGVPPEGSGKREHRGFGLLGLLGVVMTLSAGFVVLWAGRR